MWELRVLRRRLVESDSDGIFREVVEVVLNKHFADSSGLKRLTRALPHSGALRVAVV